MIVYGFNFYFEEREGREREVKDLLNVNSILYVQCNTGVDFIGTTMHTWDFSLYGHL